MTDKYYISSMKNVLQIPIEGKDLNDKNEIQKIDRLVEAKIKLIIDQLKVTHEKFIDEDFGPTPTDEFAAKSLYGSGIAGAQYPPPESLQWQRPQYHDEKFIQTEANASSTNKNSEDEDEEEEFDDEYGVTVDNEEDKDDGVSFIDKFIIMIIILLIFNNYNRYFVIMVNYF